MREYRRWWRARGNVRKELFIRGWWRGYWWTPFRWLLVWLFGGPSRPWFSRAGEFRWIHQAAEGIAKAIREVKPEPEAGR